MQGNPRQSCILDSLSVELGFRIPRAVFRIPKSRIPDSTSHNKLWTIQAKNAKFVFTFVLIVYPQYAS